METSPPAAFSVSPTNPNHDWGTGGCMCIPDGPCGPGPYVVFEREVHDYSGVNCYAVLCAGCAHAAAERTAPPKRGPGRPRKDS